MPFISRKKLKEYEESAKTLLTELEKLKNHSYLIGIEREGRENIFTFARDNQVHQIKTMGLISDNLPEWKEKLLR